MKKGKIETIGIVYTDELTEELDRRYKDYKNGKTKMITAGKVK